MLKKTPEVGKTSHTHGLTEFMVQKTIYIFSAMHITYCIFYFQKNKFPFCFFNLIYFLISFYITPTVLTLLLLLPPCLFLLPPVHPPFTSPSRLGLPWDISKVWHLRLGQDQFPPHCIKVEHGIRL